MEAVREEKARVDERLLEASNDVVNMQSQVRLENTLIAECKCWSHSHVGVALQLATMQASVDKAAQAAKSAQEHAEERSRHVARVKDKARAVVGVAQRNEATLRALVAMARNSLAPDVYVRACGHLVHQLQASTSTLYQLDPATKELRVKAATHPKQVRVGRYAMGSGAVGEAAAATHSFQD